MFINMSIFGCNRGQCYEGLFPEDFVTLKTKSFTVDPANQRSAAL